MAEQSSQRGTNPRTRDPNAVQRVSLAVKLRATRMTYEAIAAQCGYADASSCRKAVMRELERCVVRDVDKLRAEEGDSLDRLEMKCWEILTDRERKGSHLFAVDRILMIKERRAKLFGLDAAPEDDSTNQNYTKRVILTHQEVQDANPNS